MAAVGSLRLEIGVLGSVCVCVFCFPSFLPFLFTPPQVTPPPSCLGRFSAANRGEHTKSGGEGRAKKSGVAATANQLSC